MNDEKPEKKKRKILKKSVVINILCVIALLCMIGIYVTTRIHVNKVIIQPGTASSVADAITFKKVKTYAPAGTIRFLTVYVSDTKPSLLEYWKAKYWDDNDEIQPWKDVNGDFTPQQNEELNNALMKASQNAASVVALSEIGCSVGQKGSGAIVSFIQKDSPASKVLKKTDVIVGIDKTPTFLATEAGQTIRTHKIGETITLSIERGKNHTKMEIPATLVESPTDKGTSFLGVSLVTRDQNFTFPVDISIDPGAVSGPSAGLAFTLSIIDHLTKGNLVGKNDVAVTGEIELDGTVSQVGGVKEKAVAARHEGAKYMIVPKGEGKDARTRAGSMKVFEVSNISDALKVLHSIGGDPLRQVQSCPTS